MDRRAAAARNPSGVAAGVHDHEHGLSRSSNISRVLNNLPTGSNWHHQFPGATRLDKNSTPALSLFFNWRILSLLLHLASMKHQHSCILHCRILKPINQNHKSKQTHIHHTINILIKIQQHLGILTFCYLHFQGLGLQQHFQESESRVRGKFNKGGSRLYIVSIDDF